MIERQIINGRAATVGYLDQGFSPADKNAAELVKVNFDDGEVLFLSTKTPGEHAAEPPLTVPPFELRRKSRREQTPHNAAIAGFATAINEAEKHRRTLKRRFGYSDRQIGTMAMVHNSRKRTP